MRFPVDKWPDWYDAQPFGTKTDYGYHEGADVNKDTGGDTDLGFPIFAISNGVVTSVHEHINSNNFGKHVHIQHDGPWGTVYCHYAHCSSIGVKVGDVVNEGQEVARVGKSGTVYSHIHWSIKLKPTGIDAIAHNLEELKSWTDPIKFVMYWSEHTMTDEISIPKATFEELVGKSTKYDEIVKAGITSTADIDAIRRRVDDANATAGTAQQEAKDTREQFAAFAQSIAQKLNSPQDLPRILSSIDETMKLSDQAVKNATEDRQKLELASDTILKLKAEIAVLEARLKAKEWASDPSWEEIVRAIIKSLKKLVGR